MGLRPCVLESVHHQVGGDLPQARLVGEHEHRLSRLDDDRPFRIGYVGVGDGVGGHLGQVDGRLVQRQALVEAREQQQLLDEQAHAPRLLLYAAHRQLQVLGPVLGAAAEELRIATDGGERRAQLVRSLSQKAAQRVFGRLAPGKRLLDLAEHGVEGQPQAAYLGAPLGALHALGEVAGGDGARRLCHVLERAHLAAHDPPGEHRQTEQHAAGHQQLLSEQPVQRLRHLGQGDGDDERERRLLEVRGQYPVVQRRLAGGGRREDAAAAALGDRRRQPSRQRRRRGRRTAVAEHGLTHRLAGLVEHGRVRPRRQQGRRGRLLGDRTRHVGAQLHEGMQGRGWRAGKLLVDAAHEERA